MLVLLCVYEEFPPPVQEGFLFSTPPPALVMCGRVNEGHSDWARGYLRVIWICFPLIVRDGEHVFMCLLAISISSLEKCLFRSFAHFLSGLWDFMLLSCISCVCVLEIKSFSVASFETTFSHSVSCLLVFLSPFLCWAKACQFDEVPSLYFCSYFCCFGRLTWENIGKVDVRECSAYVPFQVLMVSCLTLKSLSHVEFISVHGVRGCSAFHAAAQVSQHFLLKYSLFPFFCPCLLWQRLSDHRCRGLLPGSLFWSRGLSVGFGTSTTRSWGLRLCDIAWGLGEWCLLLGLCSSGLRWQFWVFGGSIEMFG